MKRRIKRVNNKHVNTITNRELILKVVENFYLIPYNSHKVLSLDTNTKPEIITTKKGIITQRSRMLLLDENKKKSLSTLSRSQMSLKFVVATCFFNSARKTTILVTFTKFSQE